MLELMNMHKRMKLNARRNLNIIDHLYTWKKERPTIYLEQRIKIPSNNKNLPSYNKKMLSRNYRKSKEEAEIQDEPEVNFLNEVEYQK